MQQFQEAAHSENYDYRSVSPHLKYWHIYDSLVDRVRAAAQEAADRGLPRTVLEIGAGHGGFVEPLLASGYGVTATEMSRPSITRLEELFGHNPNFTVLLDPDGSLSVLGDKEFAQIVFAAVLHHIPDYLTVIRTALSQHLLAGGALVILQDPLWYPTQPKLHRLADRSSQLLWRLTTGNYRRGLGTLLRRARGVYDDANPSDNIEYHSVRRGVNQNAIIEHLRPRFERVELARYWATQASLLQFLGDRTGLANSFAITASGFLG
jgi:SAM-dependent methyltransferase